MPQSAASNSFRERSAAWHDFEASNTAIGTTDGASHRNRIEPLGQAR